MDQEKNQVWYVISSTKAQIVNLVPAAMIGFDYITHILVLRGIAAKQTDQQHAHRSLDDFQDVLQHEKQAAHLRDKSHFHILEGNADDLLFWFNQLQTFFQNHKADEVIFNLKGGLKEMSIGALMGLWEQKDELSVRYVSKLPKDIIWPFENNRKDPIPVDCNIIGINAYFRACGYKIHQPERQKQKEQLALSRQNITMDLGKLVFESDNQNFIDECLEVLTAIAPDRLNKSRGILSEGGKITVLSHRGNIDKEKRQQNFIKDIVAIFKKHEDNTTFHSSGEDQIKLNNFGQSWGNHPFVEFFKGQWFEEWIWLKCKEIAATSQAEIARSAVVRLGINVEDSRSQNKGTKDHDLDVAIYQGTQLHIIECKSGRGKNTKLQAELDRLAIIHRDLVGKYGYGWLCHARSVEDNARTYDKAKRSGLELVASKREIFKMFDKITQILS